MATPYDEIIGTAVGRAARLSVGTIFVPVVDIVGTTGIWGTMVTRLVQASGHAVDRALLAKLLAAAATGVAHYQLGSRILTWMATPLMLSVPLLGIPVAAGLNGVLNALFTYRLGVEVARAVDQPGFSGEQLLSLSFSIAGQLARTPSAAELKRVAAILGIA